MNRIIDAIEKDQFKTELPAFHVGDSIRVHTRVWKATRNGFKFLPASSSAGKVVA